MATVYIIDVDEGILPHNAKEQLESCGFRVLSRKFPGLYGNYFTAEGDHEACLIAIKLLPFVTDYWEV